MSTNSGMDADVFEQFIEQLQRYVRERLIPAEKQIIETDLIAFLRPEEKFGNLELMTEQVMKDAERAKAILSV